MIRNRHKCVHFDSFGWRHKHVRTFLIMASNTVIHLIHLVCFLYQLSLFGIPLDVETMGHVGISIYMVYTTVEKVGVDEI